MLVRSPDELYKQFRAAFSRGPAGLDDLVSLYEPDARFVPRPGEVVAGTEAIRRAYKELLEVRPQLTVEAKVVIPAGDLVLSCNKWTMKGTGADGEPVEITGMSAEVARRQTDGSRLFIIDNPYGTG